MRKKWGRMLRRRRSSQALRVRVLRVAGALSVLALLLAQLAVVGHYALVAHYLCAEHGTLHHGAAATRHVAAGSPRDRALTRAIVAEHGTHDDCAFPARDREALRVPTSVDVCAVSPAEQGLAPPPAKTAPASSVPILSRAPKQSPPLAA